jgi:hypothetical protein
MVTHEQALDSSVGYPHCILFGWVEFPRHKCAAGDKNAVNAKRRRIHAKRCQHVLSSGQNRCLCRLRTAEA